MYKLSWKFPIWASNLCFIQCLKKFISQHPLFWDAEDWISLKFPKIFSTVPYKPIPYKPSCVYLLSGTCPMSEKMFKNPTRQLQSINLSIQLTGHQLNLVKNKPAQEEEYIFQKEVPVKFWEIHQAQHALPTNCYLRRKFTSKLYDLKHKHFCNRNFKKDFHNLADVTKCKCKNCKLPMDWYHECQTILDTVGTHVSNVAS